MTMTTYTSDKDVYADSRYYKAGEPFTTDAKPAKHWKKVTPKVAATIEAAIEKVPDDAELEGLDKAALQAIAWLKHVSGIAKLDTKALITAIKAANAPKL